MVDFVVCYCNYNAYISPQKHKFIYSASRQFCWLCEEIFKYKQED